ARFVKSAKADSLRRMFEDFRYRFQTGRELAALLLAIKDVLHRHGSLQACFLSANGKDDDTVLPALSGFVKQLSAAAKGRCGHLLPCPTRGSACKRLHLFLRWMVRRDEVDPGGWDAVPAARLIVPLDTHMHKIAIALGVTRRKSADARTAAEITAAFRRISPADPVKYDFALTRLGIRDDTDLAAFLKRCRNHGGINA
ncbi:MAG: TIGR02757 family protein, partial [Phycisphaerae bacterium]|nr:TIGR02757 family protein [Phycisphaerae bacterium]